MVQDNITAAEVRAREQAIVGHFMRMADEYGAMILTPQMKAIERLLERPALFGLKAALLAGAAAAVIRNPVVSRRLWKD